MFVQLFDSLVRTLYAKFQETPTSLFSDLETLFAFDQRVKLEALRKLFQLSDGFLTVHSSARATPAKT